MKPRKYIRNFTAQRPLISPIFFFITFLPLRPEIDENVIIVHK